jgi:hypothetical protein
MRAVLLGAVLLGFVMVFSGCGNPAPEIPKDTVAYDKARDGEPKAIGPGGAGAGGLRKGSGAAPSK